MARNEIWDGYCEAKCQESFNAGLDSESSNSVDVMNFVRAHSLGWRWDKRQVQDLYAKAISAARDTGDWQDLQKLVERVQGADVFTHGQVKEAWQEIRDMRFQFQHRHEVEAHAQYVSEQFRKI